MTIWTTRAQRSRLTACLSVGLVALLAVATPASAQTNTGRISGTVTDSSGGILPGASVTVTNEGTGLSRSAVTDASGAFLFTNLPVGVYSVEATLEGFTTTRQTGYQLNADGRLTANFNLEVGGLAETVSVVAVTGETVNVVSGELSRTVDGSQVRDLALNGRNYLQLVSLVPGAVLTNDDQLDLATSLSVTGQSVNGSRGNANNLNVDGGNNLDSGSNGSQVNNVGIDFISEVVIKTSNFSAEYGRNSGASINVVTRSGTNRYDGSIFEFFRHDSLDAKNFFAPRDAAGEKIAARLRYNNFGGAFGGPIMRDRLFFFAGQEYKYIRRATSPTARSMPTTAEINGDFSMRLRGADGIVGTADDGFLRDPQSGLPCTAADRSGCFPGNRMPVNRITQDGRALASVYQAMNGLAASFNDAPVGNNAVFQLDNPFDYRQEIVRLDFKLNEAHSIWGRYLHDDYDLIEPLGTFSGSNLPTTPTNRLRPGTSYQTTHTWIARSNLINEVKVNASWNGQRIPPVGENWKRETFAFGFPQLYPGGWFPEGIPSVDVSGFANFRGPSFALMSPTTDIALQNTTTWIKGDHSIKGGFKYIRNRKDQNGRPNYLGFLNFNPGGNPNSTGQAFGDLLLGNFRTYSEASDDPVGFFRFNQYEAFAQDNWRINNRLSLELGVRYQFAPPIYSQQNNLVNFDPRLYDPGLAVQINPGNGTIVPGSGYRFNGLIRAGDGIPEDQTGRVNLIAGGDFDRIATGAPRGLYDGEHLFMPRISVAYAPSDDGRTSIRGGFGLFYDRPEGNIVFSSVNLPPVLTLSQFDNGNLANPSGGTPAALAPLAGISVIDPDLKTAYQMQYSVSVQREMFSGYFFEVSYVGNRGRNLLWNPNINQVSFDLLAANAALPAAQRTAENFMRPYAGYTAINQRQSEAESNYNGLQFYVTKRRGDLTLTGGYTLSKAETNASGFGDNPEGALEDRMFNYGPAAFDRRHVVIATGQYRVPFLRDRQDVLGSIVGGWELSAIMRIQSGQYLTVTGNTSIGGRRADYVDGQEIDLPGGERGPARWFNTAAFVVAPDTRRGNAAVGTVEGPGRYTWDLSMRKKFRVTNDVRLGVQADLFNAFNWVNFNNPSTNISANDYGRINSAGPSRQVQFGVRLEF